jgi:hypothetical protein
MSGLIRKQALDKLTQALELASEALHRCRLTDNYNDFCVHWARFLSECGKFLNVLESASSNSPKTRQWYGEVRNKGKSDPLLQYMFQARNAEEHGIEPVTDHYITGLTIDTRVGGPISIESIRTDASGKITSFDVLAPLDDTS